MKNTLLVCLMLLSTQAHSASYYLNFSEVDCELSSTDLSVSFFNKGNGFFESGYEVLSKNYSFEKYKVVSVEFVNDGQKPSKTIMMKSHEALNSSNFIESQYQLASNEQAQYLQEKMISEDYEVSEMSCASSTADSGSMDILYIVSLKNKSDVEVIVPIAK